MPAEFSTKIISYVYIITYIISPSFSSIKHEETNYMKRGRGIEIARIDYAWPQVESLRCDGPYKRP